MDCSLDQQPGNHSLQQSQQVQYQDITQSAGNNLALSKQVSRSFAKLDISGEHHVDKLDHLLELRGIKRQQSQNLESVVVFPRNANQLSADPTPQHRLEPLSKVSSRIAENSRVMDNSHNLDLSYIEHAHQSQDINLLTETLSDQDQASLANMVENNGSNQDLQQGPIVVNRANMQLSEYSKEEDSGDQENSQEENFQKILSHSKSEYHQNLQNPQGNLINIDEGETVKRNGFLENNTAAQDSTSDVTKNIFQRTQNSEPTRSLMLQQRLSYNREHLQRLSVNTQFRGEKTKQILTTFQHSTYSSDSLEELAEEEDLNRVLQPKRNFSYGPCSPLLLLRASQSTRNQEILMRKFYDQHQNNKQYTIPGELSILKLQTMVRKK